VTVERKGYKFCPSYRLGTSNPTRLSRGKGISNSKVIGIKRKLGALSVGPESWVLIKAGGGDVL